MENLEVQGVDVFDLKQHERTMVFILSIFADLGSEHTVHTLKTLGRIQMTSLLPCRSPEHRAALRDFANWSSLTTLQLNLAVPLPPSYNPSITVDLRNHLPDFLTGWHNLTTLQIAFPLSEDESTASNITAIYSTHRIFGDRNFAAFSRLRFPKLIHLLFTDLHLAQVYHLLMFLLAHRATLQTLELVDCGFGAGMWKALFEFMAQAMQLTEFRIRNTRHTDMYDLVPVGLLRATAREVVLNGRKYSAKALDDELQWMELIES